MDLHEATPEADKIQPNRLSAVTEDEEEHDAALTIVTVLDKVANIVDNVHASQKRIEERHREMEDAIKSIQIDILKLAQAHANTGYTVNKLLDKTRKVSANVKDVKERVDKQRDHVQKVESKQEELLRKNKFRVVIFQEDTPCPTKLTVTKDSSMDGHLTEEVGPPEDLSSDEEYTVAETRTSRLKKSGRKGIDNIKKAFSKEKMQKTKQNFGKKVTSMRTRIVTPERRERIRQSGERLKQSSERLKQSIAKAAPKKENFKIKISKKEKERTLAEGQEGSKEGGVDAALKSGAAEIISEEITYTEVVTVKKKEASTNTGPYMFEEEPSAATEKITLKQDDDIRVDDKAPLLDVKLS